jgi:hypothetical protein
MNKVLKPSDSAHIKTTSVPSPHLRLYDEEDGPKIWRLAANILNNTIADIRQGLDLQIGRWGNNSSPFKLNLLRNVTWNGFFAKMT